MTGAANEGLAEINSFGGTCGPGSFSVLTCYGSFSTTSGTAQIYYNQSFSILVP